MKKKTTNEEIARLKSELKIAIKQNERLTEKLKEAKSTNLQLKTELKKNDENKIVLTKKQEQLLSNLSKDTDILNLLSD